MRYWMLNRRRFLQSAAGTAAAALAPRWLWADAANAAADGPEIWVIESEDKRALMKKAMEVMAANGGLGKPGDRLTLKVNAAWARTPEQGANTHPELVRAFLEGCRDAGVTKLSIPEHPCNRADASFPRSGIEAVAKKLDVPMIDLKGEQKSFRPVDIPKGRSLKSAEVAAAFLDTDVLVNMPVAKHHGGATLTIGMKNWMGAVRDRGWWHRNDLHQCIADFSTFIRPDWTVIDATRCMLDNGPQGPTRNMKIPNLLIVSRDPIAADAFAATLFHDDVAKVKYLVYAREMGLGETDAARMRIHRLAA